MSASRAHYDGAPVRTRFHQHWQGYSLPSSPIFEDAKFSFHLHLRVGTHVGSGRDHVIHKVRNLPDEVVQWFDTQD